MTGTSPCVSVGMQPHTQLGLEAWSGRRGNSVYNSCTLGVQNLVHKYDA